MNPAQPSKPPSRIKLEELLLRHGSITAEQLEQARAEQKKWGGEIGRVMVDLGFITEQLLAQALAHSMGIPRVKLDQDAIPKEIVTSLGVQTCERFGVIAVGGDLAKKTVRVATSDPNNKKELQALAAATKLKLELAVATADEIARAIRRYYYGETEPRDDGALTPPKVAEASAAGPGLSAELFVHLAERVLKLEQALHPMKDRVAALVTNPQFAAITARLEKLEQVASNEAAAIRVIAELLLEKGIVSREEWLGRIRKK